ncbi:MAG: AAA domain-containing protein [Myxococcota bacterium]
MTPEHPHLAALHEALIGEERATAAEYRRLADLDLEAQVAAGFAWPPLRQISTERMGRRERLTLRTLGGEMLHTGIGPGEPVWVAGAPGHCDGVERAVAEVVVERAPPPGRPVEVTRRHDPSTFIRYRQGLEAADRHASPLREALLTAERTPEVQADAMAHALEASTLAVIHGPPGTGKTWTLARVLRALVDRGEQPWALADSNAAVDHLALQASTAGVDVVRVGHANRIGSAAAALSLEARMARSPLGPALAALQRDLSRAWGTPQARGLLAELRTLNDQAREHALSTAQCIAATFGTLARRAPEWPKAVTAVVDEATQASEPAVWGAVPFIERLVLVGDPEQLGPISIVPHSPLATSLLQRLIVHESRPAPMLEVQHRMATPIRELVADVYGPTYRDHPRVADQRLLDLPPITWVDTAGAGFAEARDPATQSLYNEGEVALLAMAVGELRDRGVEPERIGVIAPYSAQVGRLAAHPALAGIEVATINAFQGREKDAIAVSWVRSNDLGELGFVADPRRLTVALTRARCWLWQVGDAATLSRHPRFAHLLAHHEDHGALRSVWEPPWSDAV